MIEDIETAARSKREHHVGNGFGRVAADFRATLDAIRGATASEKKPEIIVNFGGGGDGRAWITCGIFLSNGDGGGDAGDFVDIGLFHAFEKLTGVGRKGFHVTALPFGVDSVEGERGFAGTADAGDYGKRVVGDLDRNVFEIVHTGTAYQ